MKRWLRVQLTVLFGGTLFAFFTVTEDIIRFVQTEGTIFKWRDCVYPNPAATPCFYGAFAFLIATIWTWKLLKRDGVVARLGEKKLLWLLIASTIFAWSNYGNFLFHFLNRGSRPGVSCSGVVVTNPFTTACFVGSAIFLAGLVVAILALLATRQKQKDLV